MRADHKTYGLRPQLWLLVVDYLQVNALSEWIIGIYLHEFTTNEREISIPHEALSLLKFLYLIQIDCTTQRKTALKSLYLSQPMPWRNDSGVLNLHHGYYTTIMNSRWLSVTTQYHVVQISQSENRNSYSVCKLNNKDCYGTVQ